MSSTGVMPIPCPHFKITIVKRSQGQSAVARAAYQSGERLLQDYDAVMDKAAEAEELSADHRPSTLEKLAELASDTSAPKSSARSAPEL